MPPKDFNSKRGGNCCLNLYDAFSTCATDEDIRLWEEEGREDILEWVDPISLGGGEFIYDIWINSKTGEDVNRCPWLKNYPKRACTFVEFMT